MTDSTPQPPQPSAPGTAAVADFPPQGITAFLRFCAGEWMGLRSRFALGEDTAMAEGDEWHSSERGELVVAYLEPGAAEFPADSPGGLSVGTKGEPARRLLFAANGTFTVGGCGVGGCQQEESQQGTWQLWPDGSLELVIGGSGSELRERIWFTKPNLRLRSTVESRADGSPGQASFSSEIRRVSRPAS